MKNILLGIILLGVFGIVSCSRSDPPGISTNDIGSAANTSPKSTPPSLVPAQSPPPKLPSPTPEEFKERFGDYTYYYTRQNETVVALFTEKFLPRNDTVVVGAIRDVIRKAFKEEVYGKPQLVDTTANATQIRGIRLDGPKHGFITIPMKEDNGQVHSLTITRVVR